jgi:hypothetical protein
MMRRGKREGEKTDSKKKIALGFVSASFVHYFDNC